MIQEKKYLLLISIHGLIRGYDLELGRDADTGGQTKYVVDLARALAKRDDVAQVDLVTRRVIDPHVSDDYAQAIERLSDKARIIRLDAGPDEYLPKEQLWDYLDNFTDNLIHWIHEQPIRPDAIHSHYADAGYVGVRVSNFFGAALIHTGHSLGRDKRKRLLAKGLSKETIETTYNISRRIDAEEEVLANANLVIVSTNNEIKDQYSLYNYYDPKRMRVIPPGTDLTQFYPPDKDEKIVFKKQLKSFLKDSKKPLILALSRPDERKNILSLIEAYGESPRLQELANLLIVAGTRDDIRDMESGAQAVLTNILLLIDAYNLYGKVALPKSHGADEVPSIYRLAARSKGVFINPALTEPFGLTILEAAASSLPVVATENGGPVDILSNCHNGILIDPLDKEEIADALLRLLASPERWKQASDNGLKGVREHYSWASHAESYLSQLEQLPWREETEPSKRDERSWRYRDRALITDLDQNLLGDADGLKQLLSLLQNNHRCVTFGIATGRRIDSAMALMKKHKIPIPDVLITSLGTRIHYGSGLTEDDWWANHIDQDWSPKKIQRLLSEVPGLIIQKKQDQTPFKLSYFYDPLLAPSEEEMISLLRKNDLTANVLFSFGQFMDVIPTRASKGQALRYVSQVLDIPLENMLVAGGSGADEDMMRGNTLAVVVANRHHEELSQLSDHETIYFAEQAHASGIVEATEHYDFFNACTVVTE